MFSPIALKMMNLSILLTTIGLEKSYQQPHLSKIGTLSLCLLNSSLALLWQVRLIFSLFSVTCFNIAANEFGRCLMFKISH